MSHGRRHGRQAKDTHTHTNAHDNERVSNYNPTSGGTPLAGREVKGGGWGAPWVHGASHLLLRARVRIPLMAREEDSGKLALSDGPHDTRPSGIINTQLGDP